jgi:hypothetical protein
LSSRSKTAILATQSTRIKDDVDMLMMSEMEIEDGDIIRRDWSKARNEVTMEMEATTRRKCTGRRPVLVGHDPSVPLKFMSRVRV